MIHTYKVKFEVLESKIFKVRDAFNKKIAHTVAHLSIVGGHKLFNACPFFVS